MIERSAIEGVVAQYARFGWALERVLLKDPVDEISDAFPDVPVINSSQDALWFSRASGRGLAWELRRLSGTPFALVRVIDANASDAERDEILRALEADMAERDVKPTGENSNGK